MRSTRGEQKDSTSFGHSWPSCVHPALWSGKLSVTRMPDLSFSRMARHAASPPWLEIISLPARKEGLTISEKVRFV